MLFYTALVVAGVIAAAVVVWIARSMMVAGKSAYRTLSPTRGDGSKARLAHLNSNLATAPAPWGWSGSNASLAGKGNHLRTTPEPVTRSKSRDWSELELYQRSYERERNTASPTTGSVRNLLTGYDMERKTAPDTSSWPYQEGYKPELADKNSEVETERGDSPTKPWGW